MRTVLIAADQASGCAEPLPSRNTTLAPHWQLLATHRVVRVQNACRLLPLLPPMLLLAVPEAGMSGSMAAHGMRQLLRSREHCQALAYTLYSMTMSCTIGRVPQPTRIRQHGRQGLVRGIPLACCDGS
jgi:hypothetical protein